MKILFPASYLSSQLGMTVLMVALGLGGDSHLAADVGIVQGAALALFFAFSGNVRNLILKSNGAESVRSLTVARLLLLLPVATAVFYLSSVLGGVAWEITLVLIVRKAAEWMGEIHLSKVEREQDSAFAGRHLAIQCVLLTVAIIWMLTGAPGRLAALMAWALVPLVISLPHLRATLRGARVTAFPARLLFPHLGSTAVMGIGVYVFRLIILSLVDKATAGDLYTAFAIGGSLGSVFALGLGPSLVLHEQKTGQRRMPVWLRGILVLTAVTGLVVVLMAELAPGLPLLAGKEYLFWHALGFSLLGGVIMVFAQRQRLRDLQHGTESDVFASDVLANILIVAFLPFIYYIFGRYGLSWMYLFSSSLALLFYWMADLNRTAIGRVLRAHGSRLRAALAVLLVFPIFVNLESGLFRSTSLDYDSGGMLGRLPMPLSVLGCYAGIALLGNYRRANLGLTMIFGCFVLMVLSTVIAAPDSRLEEQAKLILLMQFLLPMFALVLGMMYEDRRKNEHIVEKAMLLTVVVLVPFQLMATWAQGYALLSPYLYLFSIYQHLEYVPVIMAGSYLIALFGLWDAREWRPPIVLLTPLMGIYLAASGSIQAASLSVGGCAIFAIYHMNMKQRAVRQGSGWSVALPMFSVVLPMFAAWAAYRYWAVRWAGSAGEALYTRELAGFEMLKARASLDSWAQYLRGIEAGPADFFFGHGHLLDRDLWPSAQNYYLDFISNFGAVATLVIVTLIAYTVARLYRSRQLIMLSPATMGLTIVVLFLLLLDNLFKVGMRQPYPGIVTFFVWGLLLMRIDAMQKAGRTRASPDERAQQALNPGVYTRSDAAD